MATIEQKIAAQGLDMNPPSAGAPAPQVAGMILQLAANAVAAAGANQGAATVLSAQENTITTGSGGVQLPPSAVGHCVTVVNSLSTPLVVYPNATSDSAGTINGAASVVLSPGATGDFNCTAAGAWTAQAPTTVNAAYNTNTATAATTLTAANVTGGAATVDLAMTGALGGAANAQLPTVAALVAAMHNPAVGSSYRLRLINESSGAFAWTVTTNTGWTLTGTMSANQNTWREFVVTLTSLTTATLQNVGTGTYS